jgi:PAS domain S-box-containing protein
VVGFNPPFRESPVEPVVTTDRVKLSDAVEILNLASDAIIVCGIDRRINFWNAGAVTMYGWTVEEALDANIHDLLRTTFPESQEMIRAALMSRGSWEGELIHVSKGGKPIVVMSKHVLQKDENGTPIRILEINRDITSRKLMEQDLKHSQSELEKIVEQRTAALRGLSSRLLRIQDEERRRIARELHDSLGQYLTDAKIKLDLVSPQVGTEQKEILALARQSVERSITETRTLSYLLHPPLLDEAGLASAVGWYVEGFANRSGIEAKLEVPPDVGRLPEAIETALFRILQESLTNVHRHSASKRVEVKLAREPERVVLTVRDFGSGIPAESLSKFEQNGRHMGVGLAGMRERVNDLEGQLEIRSGPDGTVVQVWVPLPVVSSDVAA